MAYTYGGGFIADSTNAAEYLATPIMGRSGIDSKESHNLNLLANQTEGHGHIGLAESIRRMNGRRRIDHTASYGFTDPMGLDHALQRIPFIIGTLVDELEN